MVVLSPGQSAGTLRERFAADMTVRGFSAKTQHDYLRTVTGFAAFLGRSPSTATAEDIGCFQIRQSEHGMNAPAMNSAVAALRFFFNHTVDRPDLAGKFIRLRYPRVPRATGSGMDCSRPSGARDRRHPTPTRGCIPGSPCRPLQPRPAQGHGGDRSLPHRGLGWPRRGLPGLRPSPHRLQ